MNPVEIEEAVTKLAAAPFGRAKFPFAFLTAFGNKKTTIDRLQILFSQYRSLLWSNQIPVNERTGNCVSLSVYPQIAHQTLQPNSR